MSTVTDDASATPAAGSEPSIASQPVDTTEPPVRSEPKGTCPRSHFGPKSSTVGEAVLLIVIVGSVLAVFLSGGRGSNNTAPGNTAPGNTATRHLTAEHLTGNPATGSGGTPGGSVTLSGALSGTLHIDPSQSCTIQSKSGANPILMFFSFTNAPTASPIPSQVWTLAVDVPRSGGMTQYPSNTYGVTVFPDDNNGSLDTDNKWGIGALSLSGNGGSGTMTSSPNGTTGTFNVTLLSDGSVSHGPVQAIGSWTGNGC